MPGRLGSPYVIAILLLVGSLPLVGCIALYRFSDRLLRPPRPTIVMDGSGRPHVDGERRPAMIGIALARAGEAAGVTVSAIVGPGALEAGLRPGDLVVGAGGRPVANAADLQDIVREKQPGDRLSLIVRRSLRDAEAGGPARDGSGGASGVGSAGAAATSAPEATEDSANSANSANLGDETGTVHTETVLTPIPLDPSDLGLESRDVEFPGGDGLTARGWFIPAAGDPIGSAVVMHGNVSNRMRALPIALPLHKAGLSLLLFDFTGRGDSDGEFCTYGWREREDARQAALLMERLVPDRPVALCGRSLGAAVALLAAADPQGAPIDAVIADSPFANLTELISRQRAGLGVPRWPFEPLYFGLIRLRAGFHPADIDVERAAARVKAPVLLLHGELDGIVPVDHSHRIARALGGDHEIEILEGLSHNFDRPPEVVDRIVRFLTERFAADTPAGHVTTAAPTAPTAPTARRDAAGRESGT